MTVRPIRRALLSVSDKSGLVELGRALRARGAELISTGGTAAALRAAGLEVTDVSALTGFPEMLDGRVKTLHPHVHAGLLARRGEPAHEAALARHGIGPIDLLAANLYPFEAARAAGAAGAALLEEIDVGGPAMIRGAAKNHDGVAVLVDPADYGPAMAEVAAAGGTTGPTRARLAAKAFARVASYDAAVAAALAAALPTEDGAAEVGAAAGPLPERLFLTATRAAPLRYGENPHQRAALYRLDPEPAGPGLAGARLLGGKELSFNNLLDADAALAAVAEFGAATGDAGPASCVVVKHGNPCGAAWGDGLPDAWAKALAGDPVSAFGGVVAFDREVDGATARAMAETFLEVAVAPAFAAEALEVLSGRRQLRLLATGGLPDPFRARLEPRAVAGGLLLQEGDAARADPAAWRAVTRREPTPAERRDLVFAWAVAKHVKSNAIVLARGGAAVGIGMGQPNRVDAVWLAARRMAAGPGPGPCVVASDAFFPFPDGLVAAAEAGATAAVQPGGSVRDPAVVEAADGRGMAMLFTGVRHFRH